MWTDICGSKHRYLIKLESVMINIIYLLVYIRAHYLNPYFHPLEVDPKLFSFFREFPLSTHM